MTGPRRVAALRRTYRLIQRQRVSEDAPLELQHAYWRLHDAAKHEYAKADWQWESLVLRALIGAVLMLATLSTVLSVTPLALIVTGLALAQCYRIFTRHAPD